MALQGGLPNYGNLLDLYNMQAQTQALLSGMDEALPQPGQPNVPVSHAQLTSALLHLESVLQANGASANWQSGFSRQLTEMTDASSLLMPPTSRQTTEMSLMSLMPGLSQQTTAESLMPPRQMTERSLLAAMSRQTTEMSLHPGNSRQTTEGGLSPDAHPGRDDLMSSPMKMNGKHGKADSGWSKQTTPTGASKQNQGKDKQAPQQGGGNTKKNPKFANTRVSSDDFAKFDIDVDKIAHGQDQRTTVMVRKLIGPHARDNFLKFLHDCNLDKRYTFFYMPCKERRTTPAGFAFVNFMHSIDVFKLHVALQGGFWQDESTKPSLSYARFQGHAQLEEHFSASAVLHESDEQKRPIFRAPEIIDHGANGPQGNHRQDVQPQTLDIGNACGVGMVKKAPMKVPHNPSNLLPVSPMEPAFLPLPCDIQASSAILGGPVASNRGLGAA
jgi:hypothetical protein